MNTADLIKGKNLLSQFKKQIEIQLEENEVNPRSYAGILQIRDLVRKHLKNKPPFDYFNLRKRPLIGYSLKDILKNKEGQCGEATRLLYHIFRLYDIKSRRIYLYALKNQHAVLEIQVGNEWIILDSDNSPKGFYEFTIRKKRRINDLFVRDVRYELTVPSNINQFFSNYSYFNIAKITAPLGYEVYIHKPILGTLLYLYETPTILKVYFYLILLILVLAMLVFGLKKPSHNK